MVVGVDRVLGVRAELRVVRGDRLAQAIDVELLAPLRGEAGGGDLEQHARLAQLLEREVARTAKAGDAHLSENRRGVAHLMRSRPSENWVRWAAVRRVVMAPGDHNLRRGAAVWSKPDIATIRTAAPSGSR